MYLNGGMYLQGIGCRERVVLVEANAQIALALETLEVDLTQRPDHLTRPEQRGPKEGLEGQSEPWSIPILTFHCSLDPIN
jgi:hypothetical protein